MELTNRARHDNLPHDFTMDGNARLAVSKAGSLVGTRRGVNFIDGTNVVATVADNSGSERVDVTLAVASAAPSGTAGGTLAGTYPNPTLASGLVAPVSCTSSTRPAHGSGKIIYETDTGKSYVSDGTNWIYLDGPGDLRPWLTSTAPTNWDFSYGQAISRTTYALLFAVLGTTYGIGDGSTTFNVPDLRGRQITALDNMGGVDAGRLSAANTLGGTGGEEKHTLITAELAAHTHPPPVVGGGDLFLGQYPDAPGATAYNSTGAGSTAWQNAATGSTGSGTAHNVMDPYMLLNFIIRLR